MRVDATRNRDRILEAARSLVARDGAAVRMDDIAAAADLAVGTLYRHFATKDALVAAVVEDSVLAIAELAETTLARMRGGAAPGPLVDDFVRTVAARHTEDRALKAAAAALGTDVAAQHAVEQAGGTGPASRALTAVEELLSAAQRAGAVRADVVLDDVLVLLAQLPDADAPAGVRDRYVALLLAGLHATG